MANNTNLELRNQMIYQVFPRQHSKTNNFEGVRLDLNRIKELGTNILYLLPIHPIGEKNKKGTLGCPYSIKDYRLICEDLGTVDDFKRLIDDTHKLDMKIIIDVVFNHTSKDSKLLETHPEYFYKNEKNEFANRVGEWWDVTDLDYSNHNLWEELISTLEHYALLGVDGFRCDVATLVPLQFWLKARERLKKINSDIILLAESVQPEFRQAILDMGFEASSDVELYEAFDILYDYDVYDYFKDYLLGKIKLNDYLKHLIEQELIYPSNYIKTRFLENHDQERCYKYIKDEIRIRNLNAMIFFLKGIAFVYAGQEALDDKLPSLFDIDLVCWDKLSDSSLPSLIKKCTEIKSDLLFRDGDYKIILEDLEVVHLTYKNNDELMEIILNVSNCNGSIKSVLQDGEYINLFNHEKIIINNGLIDISKDPIVLKNIK